MVIYRFPSDKDNQSKKNGTSNNKSETPKMPDFIYVDEVSSSPHEDSLHEEEMLKKTLQHSNDQYPFSLRVLTFFVASILTVWVGLLAVLFLLAAAISTILLFQSPSTIQTMQKLWKSIGNFSAYALALFVATINPTFGFAILTLYAMLKHQNPEQMFVNKIFRGRFH